MMISIVSGKSGTGKTLVATSLALSLADREPVQFLDCDVDEPDAHLFLKPSFDHREVVTIPVPEFHEEKCTYCGKCGEVCSRSAIVAFARNVKIFSELCNGCGACSYLCPEKALTEEGKTIGVIESGNSNRVQFAHGKLDVGESVTLPLIKKLKEYARPGAPVIIDVSAGTSRQVVQTIRDSDFCILVTEPSPSGLYALTRAVKTLNRLDMPCGIVLNFAGTGDNRVKEYCKQEGLPVLLTIPFDTEIARLYSRGDTLVEGMPEWRESFNNLFENVREMLSERDSRPER